MLPRLEPDSKLLNDVRSLINETVMHPKVAVWATIDANREVHIWLGSDEGGDASSVRVKSVWDARTALGAAVSFANQIWPTKLQPAGDVSG